MSTAEKKRMFLNAIKVLEDRVAAHYKAHSYDGVKPPEERLQDAATLESHVHSLKQALIYLDKQGGS